ncbi:hypothetical protein TrVE_jg9256 [Triparma verrucosa]|uniref:JmjC domain-containing protein n=1 Tax=Triparma verrucosa TaxID=1606542 RepID=A0A9W7BHQ7_9STRA|nr:hypothetical protein TrVE_jg9256 [Triparma verrucosa]
MLPLLLLISIAVIHSKAETYDDKIQIIDSITRRHGSASQQGFEGFQNWIQSVASERRPLVLTEALPLTRGEVDLATFDLKHFAESAPAGSSSEGSWVLDNVKISRDEGNVFAIRRPFEEDEEGFILRRNVTDGGLESSSNVATLTPSWDNLLFNVDYADFYESIGYSDKLYWTGDLRGAAPFKDQDWWRDLVILDDLGLEDYDDEVFVPMLWMSHPGVAAQTHYDKSHNIFVQLHGEKKIKLFPPAYGRYMHSYPSVHAARKMSQIPFTDEWDPKTTIFPNSTSLKAYEVTLKPGEIIYIPPYWWHSITTADSSPALSLSVVSPSWEEAHLSKAFFAALPLSPFTTPTQKKMAVQMLLVHIISRTSKMGSPEIFSAYLYNDRWANLYPELEGRRDPNECFSKDEVAAVQVAMGKLQADEELQHQIQEAATEIANVLNDDLLTQGVRMVAMGDYIEQLAVWAVAEEQGEATPVAQFILNCLTEDNLEIAQAFDGKSTLRDDEL